jgi:hypothetical protein
MRHYKLDKPANESGHQVIQLHPYHCQDNPIELMWAQMEWDITKRTKHSRFQMWKGSLTSNLAR